MDGKTLILSIRQPWAWLIVNGHKDIENRDWPTKVRGRFFVHASKQIDRHAISWLRNSRIRLPETFEAGGIVGEATLVDCVTHHASEWFEGRYGFVVKGGKPLPFIPLRGQLGFFTAAAPRAEPRREE